MSDLSTTTFAAFPGGVRETAGTWICSPARKAAPGELRLLLHVHGHARERTGHVRRRDGVGDEDGGGVGVEGGRPGAPACLREGGQGEARVRAVTAIDLAGREMRTVEEDLLAEEAIRR